MKSTGIITEYNPFHNGHIYHIQQARELTHCDVLIAVMSPNFVQRGEPAILSKWERTAAALHHGVDLVIELPTVFATQSAQQFADAGISLLNHMGINSLVFGSESNDMETLLDLASLPININSFKELMKQGNSYPKALSLLSKEAYPNDILAIAYLKSLQKYPITPFSIQRTNGYNSLEMTSSISSASAIRQALFHHEDTAHTTPLTLQGFFPQLDDYYPMIRQVLMTHSASQLQTLLLMDEGIENLLIKNAFHYPSFSGFLNASISRRYSKSRIQRILVHLLLNHPKTLNTIAVRAPRVLGFNEIGQQYLKHLSDQEIPYVTTFKHYQNDLRQLEYQATALYSLVFPEEQQKRLLHDEVSQLIRI